MYCVICVWESCFFFFEALITAVIFTHTLLLLTVSFKLKILVAAHTIAALSFPHFHSGHEPHGVSSENKTVTSFQIHVA